MIITTNRLRNGLLLSLGILYFKLFEKSPNVEKCEQYCSEFQQKEIPNTENLKRDGNDEKYLVDQNLFDICRLF